MVRTHESPDHREVTNLHLGLKAAGIALGDQNLFNEDKWDYIGKYNQDLREHAILAFFNFD